MALSLRAEQKNISDLFTSGEDVYIIPEYQRPYSWNKDACYQLYTDITSAFLDNEDYFLGNIIMARSSEDKKKPNIVDGQQRLITLWLWIKALTLLHPEKKRLKRLLEVESVLSENSSPRVISNVYEHNDQDNLETVLAYSLSDVEQCLSEKMNQKEEIREDECSRIEANALYTYFWLKSFYDNITKEEQQSFLQFFLERVFLLPIELDGKNIDEASDRALTIFETINNRGQALEDSDIFKARLYKSAKADNKGQEFIDRWLDFNETCASLGLKVDDLFRYYYHILRAQEGDTKNEGSLREYLTSGKNSALYTKRYNEVIDDLSKITDILMWLNAPEKLNTSIAILLQLINNYTNQYPKYALVNYLFVYGMEQNENLENFLNNIVRYYYYRGATIQVKYETYRINKLVAGKAMIPLYDCSDLEEDYFNHLGILRKGYALLAHYLMYPSIYSPSIYFDKLLYNRDMDLLPSDWQNVTYEDVRNNIANIVVLDIPKKSLQVNRKGSYYLESMFEDVKNIFGNGQTLTYRRFHQREAKLKGVLMSFFSSNTKII